MHAHLEFGVGRFAGECRQYELNRLLPHHKGEQLLDELELANSYLEEEQ